MGHVQRSHGKSGSGQWKFKLFYTPGWCQTIFNSISTLPLSAWTQSIYMAMNNNSLLMFLTPYMIDCTLWLSFCQWITFSDSFAMTGLSVTQLCHPFASEQFVRPICRWPFCRWTIRYPIDHFVVNPFGIFSYKIQSKNSFRDEVLHQGNFSPCIFLVRILLVSTGNKIWE